MTVGELISLLEDVDEDAEVFYCLEQHRCSRKYAIKAASAFSKEENSVTHPKDADQVYLFGQDDGYAPSSAMDELL